MPSVTITGKQIATFLQLGLLSVLVYYGVQLVIETMDPTKKRTGQLTRKEVLCIWAVFNTTQKT
jgi:hypothetical protein